MPNNTTEPQLEKEILPEDEAPDTETVPVLETENQEELVPELEVQEEPEPVIVPEAEPEPELYIEFGRKKLEYGFTWPD